MARSLVAFAIAASAALPTGAALAAPATDDGSAEEPVATIVTLGDSYSSGSGIHSDATDYDDHGPEAHYFDPSTRLGASTCQRELDTTPGPRLAAELEAESVVVACAGARIEHVRNQLRAADISGRGDGTLITITIGGNDLVTERGENWPDVILRCITSGGCNESDRNQPANLDEIGYDLLHLYASMGLRYRESSIRVLAYPRLMQSDRWCEGVTGVNRHEADWIDEQADALNATIADAVERARRISGADIRFVPVIDEFDNRGACRFWQRDRYVNDARFGARYTRSMTADGEVRDHVDDGLLTISGASFHPSQKGYDAYLEALSASISASTR